MVVVCETVDLVFAEVGVGVSWISDVNSTIRALQSSPSATVNMTTIPGTAGVTFIDLVDVEGDSDLDIGTTVGCWLCDRTVVWVADSGVTSGARVCVSLMILAAVAQGSTVGWVENVVVINPPPAYGTVVSGVFGRVHVTSQALQSATSVSVDDVTGDGLTDMVSGFVQSVHDEAR